MTNGQFAISQDHLEQGLLLAAIHSQANWLTLKDAVTTDDFTAQKAIFRFVEEYQIQYGSLPSSEVITARFQWHPPVGDFNYWLVEMKRYILARKLTEAMKDSYNLIGEPEKTLSLLLERLSLIRSQQSNHIAAYDSSAGERLEKYRLRNEFLFNQQKLIGLRTGMMILDNTRIGWTPGELTGLYARPGVGKSWWLMWEGALSWMDGRTILCISNEMPASQLSLRIDVVIGQMLGLPIEYTGLLVGDPEVEKNYTQITNILQESQRWWTYDSLNQHKIGLGDITALIRQHDPDLIIIDNMHNLRSDFRGQTWEQMKDLCYGLKEIATIQEKPIIMTHHAVNSARGRRTENTNPGRGDDFLMPSLNDAAYGDAFVQACSDVITMCGDPKSKYINWYSLRKTRERGFQQDPPPRMALACDFAHGRIVDLSERGHNPGAVGEEAMRLLGLTSLS